MARGFGEVLFSIVDLKIAPYNILTDTVGTAVDMPEVQQLDFTPEGDTDEIKAEGYLQHLLSVMTHGTFTLSQAGIPYEALAVMTGWTRGSSGTTPNREDTLQGTPGGAGLPYFAVAGKLVGEQSDDVHIGLVCCKLDAPPAWNIEQNVFVIGESSGKAIAPNSRQLPYIEIHETAAAIDMTTLFVAAS
jgi:hypothetical protein